MAKKGFAAISFRLDNAAVQALADRLANLSRVAAKQALAKGVGEVTKEVLARAKQNLAAVAHKRTGQLMKSLGRTVKVRRDGKGVVGKVGPRSGFRIIWNGRPVNPAKYAHLIEYGRRAVAAKKKKVLADAIEIGGGKFSGTIFGKSVAAAAPRPFLRPAWDAVKDRVADIIAKHLREGIRKYFARRGVTGATAAGLAAAA